MACLVKVSSNSGSWPWTVPKVLTTELLKSLLQSGEDEGRWQYEEGCIGNDWPETYQGPRYNVLG